MMIKMRKKGFTLVEIMIVVAIIGLLAAIAIPNFVRARARAQAEACIANLRQIEGATQVWAVDLQKADTDKVDLMDLVPNYIKNTPKCQAAGGAYTLSDVKTRPTCALSTATPYPHNLP